MTDFGGGGTVFDPPFFERGDAPVPGGPRDFQRVEDFVEFESSVDVEECSGGDVVLRCSGLKLTCEQVDPGLRFVLKGFHTLVVSHLRLDCQGLHGFLRARHG